MPAITSAKRPFKIPTCGAIMPLLERAGQARWLRRSRSCALSARARRSAPAPAEPPSCRQVRFSDVGWTDVTSTTALTAELLRSIGYKPTITVLSVPVTFASMKNKDIDVFLGNWMPTQKADRAPYIADGSVSVVGTNLAGAKYTLAVPAYDYEAGSRTSTTSTISRPSSTIRSTASSPATTATGWC